LATAQGTIYVLAENTMRYFIYDNSVEQLAAAKFRRHGYRVIEDYPRGTPRIPDFAGPMRVHRMGWDYSGSLLSCNATLASHERPEAVRETYLAWKEKLKGKSD
jgi:hypothetical protein